jgi:hypothetical protein
MNSLTIERIMAKATDETLDNIRVISSTFVDYSYKRCRTIPNNIMLGHWYDTALNGGVPNENPKCRS